MAEKEDKKKQKKDAKDPNQASKNNQNRPQADKPASSGGALQWIIMAVVIVVFSGSGLILARLFAGPGASAHPNDNMRKTPQNHHEQEKIDPAAKPQQVWHYDLEPVVANPDVPGSIRYLRAVLTLEMSPELDETQGREFLKAKEPVLINWLNIYFKSLTLEDLRGEKNIKRIQARILDAFNEQLWPDSKPNIKHILLKEFAIQ